MPELDRANEIISYFSYLALAAQSVWHCWRRKYKYPWIRTLLHLWIPLEMGPRHFIPFLTIGIAIFKL